MAKWTQLNLFTGETIQPRDEDIEELERIPKINILALSVQLSIARMDRLQDTMKLVSELCECITGIVYSTDIDERRAKQHQQHQERHDQALKAGKQEPQRKKPAGQKTNDKQREAHQRLFLDKTDANESSPKKPTGRPKGLTREDRIQRNDEIRHRYFNGTETQSEIAEVYNLTLTTIQNIIHKKAGQP